MSAKPAMAFCSLYKARTFVPDRWITVFKKKAAVDLPFQLTYHEICTSFWCMLSCSLAQFLRACVPCLRSKQPNIIRSHTSTEIHILKHPKIYWFIWSRIKVFSKILIMELGHLAQFLSTSVQRAKSTSVWPTNFEPFKSAQSKISNRKYLHNIKMRRSRCRSNRAMHIKSSDAMPHVSL